MSDTPRTDALIGRNRKLDKMTDVALYLAEVAESHADLERELSAVTRERDEARADAAAWSRNALERVGELRAERDALRAEVERLKKENKTIEAAFLGAAKIIARLDPEGVQKWLDEQQEPTP